MNDTKRTIELAAGDSALIGGARITLVEKSGKRARIAPGCTGATTGFTSMRTIRVRSKKSCTNPYAGKFPPT